MNTDWLLFEEAECDPDDDFRLQFEAMRQLSPEEKAVARSVIEGLLLKHVARRWIKLEETAPAKPASSNGG